MAAVASVAAGTASALSYVWEDPGDSIMIQVSLDLVERLGAAVEQGLGTGPRGNEIGGILWGRPLPGFRRAILIEDFEVAPCEHLRGASYTLSPKDQRSLRARLARRAGQQVVGYFRSHTRPGMYLDRDDFAVFSQYFPEPWQVFLLVRPSTEGPAMGGFFFWEEGDVNRRSTYRQFPFECARLATGDFPITGGGQPAAAPPRPAPVLVPKPEARTRRRLRSGRWNHWFWGARLRGQPKVEASQRQWVLDLALRLAGTTRTEKDGSQELALRKSRRATIGRAAKTCSGKRTSSVRLRSTSAEAMPETRMAESSAATTT